MFHSDVVKITWYIKDYKPAALPVIREIRDRYADTAHPPASTLAGVSSLFLDDYLIEVDAIAVIPDRRR